MEITNVILVDEQDNPIGVHEKLDAHKQGLLHRAFSIFIFNSKGEMLLQQRAINKYHCGGLWTNACCSHPVPGEQTDLAAIRRIKEELGFMVPVQKIFDFVYTASFSNGLTEYEFDHVFVGEYDGVIQYNPEEVMDISYKPLADISDLLQINPKQFTPWFAIAFPKIEAWYKNQQELA